MPEMAERKVFYMNEKTKKLMKWLLLGATGIAGVSGWALFVKERKECNEEICKRFDYETKAKGFADPIVRREGWLRDGAARSWFGLLPSEERTIESAKNVYREAYGPIIEDIENGKAGTPG